MSLLALAAELNGYPGPAHVVELGEALGLSETQQQKAQALFAAMKAETIPLGEKLIAEQAGLERQFAGRAHHQGEPCRRHAEHRRDAGGASVDGRDAGARADHTLRHVARPGRA